MRPFRPSAKNATAGFTLLEMLAVVVIIAVLAAIAAPGWLRFIQRQRVSAVKSDLVQLLRQAQQEAISQRAPVMVGIYSLSNTAPDDLPPSGEDLPTVKVFLEPIDLAAGEDFGAADGDIEELGPNSLRPGMAQLDVFGFDADGNKDTSLRTITFDHQGMPREQRDSLPIVIDITPEDDAVRQCVVVASLLGTIKTAENDACENPPL